VKYLKWVALVLVVLAIIAAVVLQWRRDAIALDIANRVMQDTDFVVESISVRKLGVEHIELSSIVLATPGGTRYEIAGIDYPLTVRGTGPRHIDIRSVVMTWSDGKAQATSLTNLARIFLALPDTLANTGVRVERATIQALPELSAISWTTSGRGQTFMAEIAGLTLHAAVTQPADDTHEVRIAVSDAAGTSALRGSLALTDREQRIGIDGELNIDAAVLEPLLRTLGWAPESVETLLATVDGSVAVDLDVDGNGNLAIRFGPALSAGSSLTWRGEDGMRIAMTLDAESRIDVALAYPVLSWTVDAGTLRGTLELDDGNKVSATLSDVHCHSGVKCTLRAAARTGPIAWGDVSVRTIDVREASGITFGFDASGWSATIERLDLAVDELRPAEDLLASMNFVVSDLQVADGMASVEATFRSTPGAGRLQFGDLGFAVPGTQGTIERAGDALQSSLQLFDKANSLSANIVIDYDIAAARGSARIRDGVVNFGRRKLSGRVVGWAYPWDMLAGTWSVTADLDWTSTRSGLQYRGHSTHRIEGLAGLYNDIGMAGLATTLNVDIDSGAPLVVKPASISVDLVDIGVPINNVLAEVTLDVADVGASVNGLSGEVLGGRFVIEPFTYAYGAGRTNLQVNVEHVQPQFMVDLADFEKLRITGTMSGMLPVTLVGNAVRIENGQLKNDPPGGVIRYGGDAVSASANAQLSIVTGALSNFVYDSLTASVDYTETGDLKLGMRLKGINPERDPTQPIILNLNVDNNIPQMLRSLQAVRSIEDILERRTAN
jgi:hypothetical protein